MFSLFLSILRWCYFSELVGSQNLKFQPNVLKVKFTVTHLTSVVINATHNVAPQWITCDSFQELHRYFISFCCDPHCFSSKFFPRLNGFVVVAGPANLQSFDFWTKKKSEKCFEVQLTGTFLLLGKNRQQSLKRLLKYPGSLLDNKREECVSPAVFPCSHTTLGFPQIKAGQPEDRK